jgi:hypothetical protein
MPPLIQLEGRLVILGQLRILILFAQEAVAYRQHFHIGALETPKRILRRINNWPPIYRTIIYYLLLYTHYDKHDVFAERSYLL